MSAIFSKPKVEAPPPVPVREEDPTSALQDEAKKRKRSRLNLSRRRDILDTSTSQKTLLGS